MDNYTGFQNRYNGRMFCEKSCAKKRNNPFLKRETIRSNDLDYQITKEIFNS